jgi:hypothetical protein
MATELVTIVQSTTEVRTHYVDFTADLPTGITVSSGTAVHTPPSGAATTPTVGAVMTGDILPVTVGPLSAAGRHIVTVTATLSNADKSVARLIIPVEWDTARSGLVDILAKLRGMANVGSDDYAVGGRPFWTDIQLQEVLDQNRRDRFRAPMQPVESYNGGTVQWKDYYSGIEHLEKTTGGTSIFYLETAAGSAVGTALYTMDYARGVASFAANTGGSTYFLYGRSFDLNRSAADIWRQKASYYAADFNFTTDNMRVDRSNIYKHCLDMADYYEQRSAEMNVVEMWRSDCTPGMDWRTQDAD